MTPDPTPPAEPGGSPKSDPKPKDATAPARTRKLWIVVDRVDDHPKVVTVYSTKIPALEHAIDSGGSVHEAVPGARVNL